MSPCFKCQGLCCRYVTVDIPAPEDYIDFDEIHWFLLHRNVIIYKAEDQDNWCIEFRSSCKYLNLESGLCMQYEKRPEVCRIYTTDECGRHEEMTSAGCEVFFESEEDLRRYLLEKYPKLVDKIFR